VEESDGRGDVARRWMWMWMWMWMWIGWAEGMGGCDGLSKREKKEEKVCKRP